jgi:spermidine synthase
MTFDDPWTPETTLRFTVTEVLEGFESPYQRIDVFETREWGTVLALGGVTNVTDRDESPYHEMIAHIPLCAHPNPRRVLVIGGGDGGTLREVMRHPGVEEAVLVDIDAEVIRCARQYFPHLAASMDDPRARIVVGDGLAYVSDAAAAGERFDVVLVDSTDPVDAAVGLFTLPFYQDCAALLGDTGILVPQSDSPVFCIDRVKHIHETLSGLFESVSAYIAQCVAYPGGSWCFIAATNGPSVRAGVQAARLEPFASELRYLNGEIASACFALPQYMVHGLSGTRPTQAGRMLCE